MRRLVRDLPLIVCAWARNRERIAMASLSAVVSAASNCVSSDTLRIHDIRTISLHRLSAWEGGLSRSCP